MPKDAWLENSLQWPKDRFVFCFLIGCFVRLLTLKSLLIRFPLGANVKGHLFRQEAAQPHQQQNSQAGSRQASLTEGMVQHNYYTA